MADRDDTNHLLSTSTNASRLRKSIAQLDVRSELGGKHQKVFTAADAPKEHIKMLEKSLKERRNETSGTAKP